MNTKIRDGVRNNIGWKIVYPDSVILDIHVYPLFIITSIWFQWRNWTLILVTLLLGLNVTIQLPLSIWLINELVFKRIFHVYYNTSWPGYLCIIFNFPYKISRIRELQGICPWPTPRLWTHLGRLDAPRSPEYNLRL